MNFDLTEFKNDIAHQVNLHIQRYIQVIVNTMSTVTYVPTVRMHTDTICN